MLAEAESAQRVAQVLDRGEAPATRWWRDERVQRGGRWWQGVWPDDEHWLGLVGTVGARRGARGAQTTTTQQS